MADRRFPRALRPWSRFPVAGAEGSLLRSRTGREYIDLTSANGVAAVGHRHPRVMEALRLETGLPIHTITSIQDFVGLEAFIEALASMAGLGPDHTGVVTVSGSDAVELALKIAELHTGRTGVVCLDRCFHGRTLGLLRTLGFGQLSGPFPSAATGRPVCHVDPRPPDVDAAVATVEAELGSGRYGALLFEPLQGLGGLTLPDPGWLTELIGTARRHGAVVIADEVFTGFGRAGQVLLSRDLGLDVDLFCVGKALTGGVPGGALLGPGELFDVLITDQGLVLDGPTFLANPLVCSVMHAVLGILTDEDLVGRSRWVGDTIRHALGDHPLIRNGQVELVGTAAASGLHCAGLPGAAGRAVHRLGQLGVFSTVVGFPVGDTVVLAPPLNIPETTLAAALEQVRRALDLEASS